MEDLKSLSIDELKKIRLKEKTNNLSKGLNFTPLNPIDKFTSIDELLREDIIAQRENTIAMRELANLTHKLLLAIALKDGTGAFIQPNGVDTKAILEGLKGGGDDDYQTRNPIMHNIDGNDANIRIEGSGIIDTIKLVSNTTTTDNKDYTIELKSDNTILYNNTFAELEARTGTERGMVCYEDMLAFKYLLIFRTILYTKGFEIRVLNAKGKFESFQIKYHKKV